MSKMKYIVVRQGGIEEPFIFSDTQAHADVARKVGGIVMGAGFCGINAEGQFSCWGESVTLKIKSRLDEDNRTLNRRFGLSDDWL